MRLRRLSDIQHAKQSTTLFTPEDPIVPSSGRDPACRSKPANLETSAQLKTLAPPHDLGAAPSRQQAPSGKALPRYAGQKWAPAKHSQRADAPRHLADPLSSKPVAPRKRNISEVLNLFKGKVSQAVAQRKHLKPARLDVSSGDKAMHRHRKSYEDVAKGWAAAEDMAVHTGKPHHRQHAAGCKAETLREEQPKSQNNRQVRCPLPPRAHICPAQEVRCAEAALSNHTCWCGTCTSRAVVCQVLRSSQGDRFGSGACLRSPSTW